MHGGWYGREDKRQQNGIAAPDIRGSLFFPEGVGSADGAGAGCYIICDHFWSTASENAEKAEGPQTDRRIVSSAAWLLFSGGVDMGAVLVDCGKSAGAGT